MPQSSRTRAASLLLLGALLASGAACTQSDQPAPTDFGNPFYVDNPAEAFAVLEARLRSAPDLYVGATVIADSTFPAMLATQLWLGPRGRARLQADGTFPEFAAPATLRLISDGREMAGGRSADVGFRADADTDVREALLLGLTRMGLFHNLTRLFTGTPPEPTEGEATDWVEVHSFEWLDAEVKHRVMTRPLRFNVRVAGEETGAGVLYIRRETGLPVHRVQTTLFAGDTLTVEEKYIGWSFETPRDGTYALEEAAF